MRVIIGMNTMTTHEFLSEFALIVRGEHPAWSGDRLLNAETFFYRFLRDCDWAPMILADIEKNPVEASELSGLPPSRIGWMISAFKTVKGV